MDNHDSIDKYSIHRKLGEGGMGVVYLAQHTALERFVALKVLHLHLAQDEALRKRFHNEAKVMAKLIHPNIVQLFDYLEVDKKLVLVMEFVEGRTLQEMIFQETGLLTAERAIPLFIQMVEGVKYAHQLGITHRDIKPSNILITKSNQAKITDFGIAKIAGDKSHTKTGTKVGTLCYMSPEQVLGQPADQKSDIYSLGLTLYVMLTGMMPLDDDTLSEFLIMDSIVKRDLPDPRTFYPDIPEYYVKVILQAIEKDPSRRFQSCDAFLKALQHSPEIVIQTQNIENHAPAETLHQTTDEQKHVPVDMNTTSEPVPQTDKNKEGDEYVEPQSVSTVQKKKFSRPIVLIVLLILLVMGGFGYWKHNQKVKKLEYQQELAIRFIYPVQSDNGKWGFEDQNGKIVIEPQYEDAQTYVNGLARVKLNNQYGFIDKKGDLIVPTIYQEAAKQYSEGMVSVMVNRYWGFLNTQGQMVIGSRFEGAFSFKQNRSIVIMNGKRGFIDQGGRWIVEPAFEEANFFSDGLAKCKYNGLHGYINLNGEVVIPFAFKNALRFENGFAPVAIQKFEPYLGKYALRYGYINHKGEVTVDFIFEDARQYSEGSSFVKQNGTWHMIQKDRTLRELPSFIKDVWGFKEGMLRVYSDRGYNFYDSNFQFISNSWFENALDFYEGKAQVQINGRWRLIDKSGQYTTQWKK